MISLDYGIYKNARNASWQCLIDCSISELPIKPVQIAANYGIHCKQADKSVLKGASGEIECLNGEIFISFDIQDPRQRQRYTVMHELGHYLLGHLGNEPLSRRESECRPEEEQAADKFAIDMLAPACVLWGLDLHTAEEIAQLCNISMQAAKYRAERMKLLYKRNKFLSHQLERMAFNQFKDFLNKNKR